MSHKLNLSNVTVSNLNQVSGNSPNKSEGEKPQLVSDSLCGTRAKGKTPELESLLQELESFCYYNPNSGAFIATRKRHGSHVCPGMELTSLDARGYPRIYVGGRMYKSHNLAWLWMLGDWPKQQIDHINRDQSDNSWSNLRDTTSSINNYNRQTPRNNNSGVTGVCWATKVNKWQASIKVNKKTIFLGYYSFFEDAIMSRKSAEKLYFPTEEWN